MLLLVLLLLLALVVLVDVVGADLALACPVGTGGAGRAGTQWTELERVLLGLEAVLAGGEEAGLAMWTQTVQGSWRCHR